MSLTLKEAIKHYTALTLIVPEEDGSDLIGGAPVLLFFDMERQVQSQWCWAATSASVSKFYDSASAWTQCLIAERIMGSACCITPLPCNKPWYLDKALSVSGNFAVQSSALTFQEVESELSSGHVIGARVGWRGGGGHFMVIYGCKTVDDVNYYSIDDPIYGKSEITEKAFLTAYQGAGSWTHAYTTKP